MVMVAIRRQAIKEKVFERAEKVEGTILPKVERRVERRAASLRRVTKEWKDRRVAPSLAECWQRSVPFFALACYVLCVCVCVCASSPFGSGGGSCYCIVADRAQSGTQDPRRARCGSPVGSGIGTPALVSLVSLVSRFSMVCLRMGECVNGGGDVEVEVEERRGKKTRGRTRGRY
jgi:hypothetical protein